MRSSFPPLSCLLAFESAARRKSFKQAAAELNLTPSAISHQIAKLEELLEVKLFERTGRQIALTVAGMEYLGRLSGALDSISVATDNVRKGVNNSLFVHCSPSFASLWLMPRLADFARRHPHISLSLSSSVTYSDFGSGQADIDIRYGIPNWPMLSVQPIFNERILPMASPEFLRLNHIKTPEDLKEQALIQSMVNVMQWSDWFKSRKIDYAPNQFAYRFDRTAMALEAAVQGLGIAFDSASIASIHLRAGRLQPVFNPAWCCRVQAHFLVCPARHLQRPAVINFIQWIKEQVKLTAKTPRTSR
jgi:DNA-binding transcriptional LysR family regulator